MLKLSRNIAILILSIFFFSACSEYQKILKSNDYELKLEKANEYYEEEDYYRAQALYEELLSIYKGTDKAEKIYYKFSYCYFNQKDYILAGYHFENFVSTYPNSKYAEECDFLSAYCYYLESPQPDLDQSNTRKAIDALQLFINKYPGSEKIVEANKLIDELRLKLETKSFNNAKLYYNLGEYKSAVIALKNTLKDYPDTQYREELLFLILKSNFLLAKNSIEAKKIERYQTTVNEYYSLIDEYPNSKNIKEAEKIYNTSIKEIKQEK
ncbi:MAG: outer membrane protein assembly factor BamD [Bacteroidetes bacterium]|nr:MAG: outer membrane protein assembly factor BamD [Bacteroidota bacterium]